ncbi:eukaryotic mitochondrial regulator protein-domain-containing protein [Lobosporangium transversale]|uniref:Eukaryotic mitochondrial regulator protein-domain-containing protein n=1 Tax=Lobosporangium transversale TaxID=64571 RepID=A0A1Y2H0L7_9FUNG|nr:eukaryotic mitochondrial regulator protein-domain-containing protein [Lobosporangium transversale]ORZ26612.1 eukaryotic mitochondrial regulator protein-domain-containing protein [Lobosporangium transversale]|eukprot:XP_021884375.1 eukaryotic mitochondrial regulator protein-domain-containing protein [Lobosporangium transversale]
MASLSPVSRALWSLKTSRTPVTGVSSIISQRFFHISHSAFKENDKEHKEVMTAGDEANEAQAETEAMASTNIKLPHRRKRFHAWLQSEGTRFEKPSFSGPNYVSDVPFPMNPLFKPIPPISNSAKEEIYKLHCSDTSKWTPRQLGMKYNISIKRVEAILRLKHLEKEMVAEGFVPQENFTRGMEQLMGVKAERSAAIVEPLIDILPQVGSPKFEAVDEDQEFTPEDAAKALKRRPLAEIKAQQLEQEMKKPFKLVDSVKGIAKPQPPQTTPISKNNAESNPRFKFSIVDTSAKTTLIREKDGSLIKVLQA